MITTKRQINTAKDRFGGFAYSNSATMSAVGIDDVPSDISSMKNHSPENSIMLSDPMPAVEDIRMTAAPSASAAAPVAEPMRAPEKRETPLPELPKRPQKVREPRDIEDLMPSMKTRRMVAAAPEEAHREAEMSDAIPARREHGKLNPRTKILLFVYIAVALVLAIAVIATGISISNAQAEANAISDRIAEQRGIISEQSYELAESTDPDTIRSEAAALGMIDSPETAESVELVEKIDYPTPTPHSNGFDGFCDWLSKVLL